MGDTRDACTNSHGPCPAGSRPTLPSPVGVKVQRPCPSQEARLCLRGGELEGGLICLFVCGGGHCVPSKARWSPRDKPVPWERLFLFYCAN